MSICARSLRAIADKDDTHLVTFPRKADELQRPKQDNQITLCPCRWHKQAIDAVLIINMGPNSFALTMLNRLLLMAEAGQTGAAGQEGKRRENKDAREPRGPGQEMNGCRGAEAEPLLSVM